MKNLLSLPVLVVVLLAIGFGFGLSEFSDRRTVSSTSKPAAQGLCPGGATPLYWKAPMDPTYVRDEPGKSPMGMDLVPQCPSAAAAGDPDTVHIDSVTIQNMGVRTAPATLRDLSRAIRAVGRVTNDERLVSHVHTKVQGWVERLFVDYLGQEVKKGDPLLEIYSPELVATQEELLLAARYRDATRESPFEDVRRGGQSLYEATRRRLELWDIPQRDIEGLLDKGKVKRTLTRYAPASGVVTELGVRSGMEVKPNDNLYTIADLSSIWVLADIYEYELPWVALGQEGVVELSYLPGRKFTGPVTHVSPFLDPKTRTAQIRLELPNLDRALKPEMFGNTVIAGMPREGVLAVSQDAIIHSGRRSLVIVALGEGRFDPRDVELGLDSGDGWIEVTRGLSPGEEVVVSGQFLIDSESNLQEAVKKLLAGAPGEGESPTPASSPAPGHEHHPMNGGE